MCEREQETSLLKREIQHLVFQGRPVKKPKLPQGIISSASRHRRDIFVRSRQQLPF